MPEVACQRGDNALGYEGVETVVGRVLVADGGKILASYCLGIEGSEIECFGPAAPTCDLDEPLRVVSHDGGGGRLLEEPSEGDGFFRVA